MALVVNGSDDTIKVGATHWAPATLKHAATIDTIKTESPLDQEVRLVEDTGFYRYDASSTVAADDFNILLPSSGVGRWILEGTVGPQRDLHYKNQAVDNDINYDTYIVDTVRGSDTTGNGSSQKPFKTIEHAADQVWTLNASAGSSSKSAWGSVLVRRGKYLPLRPIIPRGNMAIWGLGVEPHFGGGADATPGVVIRCPANGQFVPHTETSQSLRGGGTRTWTLPPYLLANYAAVWGNWDFTLRLENLFFDLRADAGASAPTDTTPTDVNGHPIGGLHIHALGENSWIHNVYVEHGSDSDAILLSGPQARAKFGNISVLSCYYGVRIAPHPYWGERSALFTVGTSGANDTVTPDGDFQFTNAKHALWYVKTGAPAFFQIASVASNVATVTGHGLSTAVGTGAGKRLVITPLGASSNTDNLPVNGAADQTLATANNFVVSFANLGTDDFGLNSTNTSGSGTTNPSAAPYDLASVPELGDYSFTEKDYQGVSSPSSTTYNEPPALIHTTVGGSLQADIKFEAKVDGKAVVVHAGGSWPANIGNFGPGGGTISIRGSVNGEGSSISTGAFDPASAPSTIKDNVAILVSGTARPRVTTDGLYVRNTYGWLYRDHSNASTNYVPNVIDGTNWSVGADANPFGTAVLNGYIWFGGVGKVIIGKGNGIALQLNDDSLENYLRWSQRLIYDMWDTYEWRDSGDNVIAEFQPTSKHYWVQDMISVGGTTIGTKTISLDDTGGTPVVTINGNQVLGPRVTAIGKITTTATVGTLPTPDATMTFADAATPTNAELLEGYMELEAKVEAIIDALGISSGHGATGD